MTFINIKDICFTTQMINFILQINPYIDISNIKIINNNDFPLSIDKYNELLKTRYQVIGEDNNGYEIYNNQIEKIPPIDVIKNENNYIILNGRHRTVYSFINGINNIEINI